MKTGLDLTIEMIEEKIKEANDGLVQYKDKNEMLENYYEGRLTAFTHCLELITIDKRMQK